LTLAATTNVAANLTVLANDTDADLGDVVVFDTTNAIVVTTTGTGIATAVYDTVNNDIDFTADAAGTYTFDYAVSDGNGGTDTATATVTVADPVPVNTPPVAVDDLTLAATTNVAANLTVLANDTDADLGDVVVFDTTDAIVVTTTGTGIATAVYDTVNNDIDFIAATAGTYTFDYAITDGIATSTATATVTVTGGDVTAENVVDMAAGSAYTGTDGVVDVFQYEVDSTTGRVVGKDGEVSITGFNVTEDRFEFVDAGDNLTTANFETFPGVSIDENPFQNYTAIAFDPDAGVSNVITIAGIEDKALDTIDFLVV